MPDYNEHTSSCVDVQFSLSITDLESESFHKPTATLKSVKICKDFTSNLYCKRDLPLLYCYEQTKNNTCLNFCSWLIQSAKTLQDCSFRIFNSEISKIGYMMTSNLFTKLGTNNFQNARLRCSVFTLFPNRRR